MVRLFKLVFIIVILSAAYFSYKAHVESSAPWHAVTTQQNKQIKFPVAPKHTQKIRDFPIIGQSSLHIYQQQTDPELFAYIELQTRKNSLDKFTLKQIETAVFALNGTEDLKITNKRFFDHQSIPTLDYVAHDTKGNLIYCRTYKLDDLLVSLIYASSKKRFNKKRHKQFFDSLKL
ncbi:hypothetical protein MNBD_GAMMA21-2300 [hydrothermal vent metagenome]|uniref:DUF1795 domain-containing protein n=1 Tax=hydrothermal vent metagenome TaxID=652676 RepID=A0A3B1ALV3_9ZZZZ